MATELLEEKVKISQKRADEEFFGEYSKDGDFHYLPTPLHEELKYQLKYNQK